MSFLKEMISGVIKKFEIFEEFYKYRKNDIDFKTRIDEYEIDDMTLLHTLHEYWKKEWGYNSPLEPYLERKKRLRVSRDGLGRNEMMNILRESIEEKEQDKTSWDKLVNA